MRTRNLGAAVVGTFLTGLFILAFGCGDAHVPDGMAIEQVTKTVSALTSPCDGHPIRGIVPLGTVSHSAPSSLAVWTTETGATQYLSASPAFLKGAPGSGQVADRIFQGIAWNAPTNIHMDYVLKLWETADPNASPYSGTATGCQTYYANTAFNSNQARWPDNSFTLLPAGAYKIFAANGTNGNTWIERLDLPIGGGTTLVIAGGVKK